MTGCLAPGWRFNEDSCRAVMGGLRLDVALVMTSSWDRVDGSLVGE